MTEAELQHADTVKELERLGRDYRLALSERDFLAKDREQLAKRRDQLLVKIADLEVIIGVMAKAVRESAKKV